MKARITGIFDHILDGSAALSGVLLIIIMIAVSLDVTFRYFFRMPIMGMDEITANLLLYITFLGTAWLLRRGGHITIDILSTRLKPKVQGWLNTTFSIVGAAMSLVLLWNGILATLDVYSRGAVTPTVLELPRAGLIIIIPIGSFLLFLQFVRKIWLAYFASRALPAHPADNQG